MTTDLTVVVPTFNERPNIRPLLEKLQQALKDINWEVVFVDDDSRDGTADEVRAIAHTDARVRCIQRVGRRGLSSACIEGMASSSAPILAVMDADLQHDEQLLPQMLSHLRENPTCDIVVGSRYIAGGGVGQWNARRQFISRFATNVGHRILRTPVADPMSGFFMLRQGVFWSSARYLSGRGFKILLDLMASSPTPLKVHELPFRFRERQAGESKLDTMIALEFGFLLFDKLFGGIIPLNFVLFVAVGGLGALIHLSILGGFHLLGRIDFWAAQTIATGCAMLVNFIFNNVFTYRDRRLKGSRLALGLLLFVCICSVGAVVNVRVATYLFAHAVPWWLSGLLGAAIGAVWNYALSSQVVWRANPARR